MRFTRIPLLFLASLLVATQIGTAQKRISDPAVKSNEARNATGLASGQATTFSLPTLQSGSSGQLSNGVRSHTIQVLPGATQLLVELSTAASANVDLYLRNGSDVAQVGNSILYDYASQSVAGNETITVNNPVPGIYYIAYGLFTPDVSPFVTVRATVYGGTQCSYSLAPPSPVSIGSVGGTGSVVVNTSPGCSWTAVSDTSWLRPTTPSGNGTSNASYVVDPNGGRERTGRITIADQVYTLTQAGVVAGLAALPDNALIVSQFVGGGSQWNTALIVTNVSAFPEGYTIRFFDDAGLPKIMPIINVGPAGHLSGTLAAGATRIIETGVNADLQIAWAAVIPDTFGTDRLSGFAVLREALAGNTSAEATVNFTRVTDTKQVLFYDEVAPYSTALTLVNLDPSTTANITVEARNEGGSLYTTKTIQLPPFGHGIYFIAQEFPQLVGKRGTIRFSNGSRGLTGLGLRFGGTGGAFTSFPMLTTRDAQ